MNKRIFTGLSLVLFVFIVLILFLYHRSNINESFSNSIDTVENEESTDNEADASEKQEVLNKDISQQNSNEFLRISLRDNSELVQEIKERVIELREENPNIERYVSLCGDTIGNLTYYKNNNPGVKFQLAVNFHAHTLGIYRLESKDGVVLFGQTCAGRNTIEDDQGVFFIAQINLLTGETTSISTYERVVDFGAANIDGKTIFITKGIIPFLQSEASITSYMFEPNTGDFIVEKMEVIPDEFKSFKIGNDSTAYITGIEDYFDILLSDLKYLH